MNCSGLFQAVREHLLLNPQQVLFRDLRRRSRFTACNERGAERRVGCDLFEHALQCRAEVTGLERLRPKRPNRPPRLAEAPSSEFARMGNV